MKLFYKFCLISLCLSMPSHLFTMTNRPLINPAYTKAALNPALQQQISKSMIKPAAQQISNKTTRAAVSSEPLTLVEPHNTPKPVHAVKRENGTQSSALLILPSKAQPSTPVSKIIFGAPLDLAAGADQANSMPNQSPVKPVAKPQGDTANSALLNTQPLTAQSPTQQNKQTALTLTVAGESTNHNITSTKPGPTNQQEPAMLVSAQTNLKPKQPALPTIITPANFPEKMEAPLEVYEQEFDKSLQNTRYNKIPVTLRTGLEQAYALEYIDSYGQSLLKGDSYVTGYSKVKPNQISLPSSWANVTPNTAQKIYAGFDELATTFTKDQDFLKHYQPGKTSNFMTKPTSSYFTALQDKFPNAPEELLITYVLKYLEAHNNQYQKRYLVFDDTTKPIKTEPSDIVENPGWPTEVNSEGDLIGNPTPLQKLYAAMEGIEAVAQKAATISQNGAQLSYIYPAKRFLQQAGSAITTAQALYKDPLNTGLDLIRQMHEKEQPNSSQPSINLVEQLSPANRTFINTTFNNTAQAVATALGDAAEASTKPHDPTQNSQPSIFEIEPTTQQAMAKMQAQVIDAGRTHAKNALSGAFQATVEANQEFKAFLEQPEVQNMIQEIQTNPQADTSAFINTAVKHLGPQAGEYTKILIAEMTKPGTSILTPENTTILQSGVRNAANVLVKEVLPPIKKGIEEIGQASSEEKAAPSFFTQENQEGFLKLIDTAFQKAADMIAGEQKPKKPTIEKQPTLPAKKPIQSVLPTKPVPSESQNSPNSIKNNTKAFVANFTESISKFFNLKGTEKTIIQGEIEKSVNELKVDKNSWWYAKPEEMNRKFQIWFHKLVTRCYNLAGKQRANIQVLQVNENTDNTLTPKITLIYNKATDKMLPAMIEFQGNKYTVSFDNIIAQSDGTFIIETPLLKKREKVGLISKLALNPIKKGVINTLSTTALGDAVGAPLKPELDDALLDDPNKSPGKLTITYNPKANTIKMITALDQTPVEITAPYRRSNRQAVAPTIVENIFTDANTTPKLSVQNITLAPEIGDLFVPRVNIKYTPEKGAQGIESVTLQAEHLGIANYKLTQKDLQNITYNNETKEYTIRTKLPVRPTTGQENFLEALYQKGIKIIEQGALAKSLSQQMPETIKGSFEFLRQASPQALEEITIIYNPSKQQIKTHITTPMTNGTQATTNMVYNMA